LPRFVTPAKAGAQERCAMMLLVDTKVDVK